MLEEALNARCWREGVKSDDQGNEGGVIGPAISRRLKVSEGKVERVGLNEIFARRREVRSVDMEALANIPTARGIMVAYF